MAESFRLLSSRPANGLAAWERDRMSSLRRHSVGVAGGLSCPGRGTLEFGGNTTCLEIRAGPASDHYGRRNKDHWLGQKTGRKSSFRIVSRSWRRCCSPMATTIIHKVPFFPPAAFPRQRAAHLCAPTCSTRPGRGPSSGDDAFVLAVAQQATPGVRCIQNVQWRPGHPDHGTRPAAPGL